MDWSTLFLELMLNLIITAIAYLFIPVILCAIRKKYTLAAIKKIVLINGVLIWLFFTIIRINAGIEGFSAAVILWSGVAYWLLKNECLTSEEESHSASGITAKNIPNAELRQMYKKLNPSLSGYIFPNGKDEFMFVGHSLKQLFKNRNLVDLVRVYGSVYTYYMTSSGNAYKTYSYAQKKHNGLLTDEETTTLIALVSMCAIIGKTSIPNSLDSLETYEGFIRSYIDTVIGISQNPDIFATKNLNVGSFDNPILVDGVTGIHKYLDNLHFPETSHIKYERVQSVHLSQTTESAVINYAIDEYVVKYFFADKELVRLWFNIYGTENCSFTPKNFSFKNDMATEESSSNNPDQNKNEKNTPLTPPHPEVPTQPTPSTSLAHQKIKYCSRCGHLIDPETKKCTGCGKQYFKGIPTQTLTRYLIPGLLVLSLCLNLFLYNKYAWEKSENSFLEADINSLNTTIENRNRTISNLENQILANQDQIDFFDRCVVFIEDDGTNLYHKYACDQFKGNSFWALNVEAAKGRGYSACPKCH